LIALLAMCAVPSAWPQTQEPPSAKADEGMIEQKKLYADSHPYLDELLPKLKKMLPILDGMKPVPTQDQLPDILAKVGARAEELLHKVPNLVSDEEVREVIGVESRKNSTYFGLNSGSGTNHLFIMQSAKEQKFNFIILSHPSEAGGAKLQEYRISRDGKPIPEGTAGPQFQGFVSTWIVFSPRNQRESHFRLLGEQKVDGYKTFVVAFAQIPGSVGYPGNILIDNRPTPLLLQGIAWVDQSDFRIVRLRTDILAPQPQIGLEKQAVNIRFGNVHIEKLDLELWLPQEADAVMEAKGMLVQEGHKYSKYRLYAANSKIIY
jgi:hypothetical protein